MDSSSSFFRSEILICQQCCKIFGETVQYQYHDCKPNRERFLKLIANTSEIQLARGIWKSWKTKNPLYQCLENDESWYFLPEVTKENWLQVSRMLKNGDYMMSKEGTTTTTNNNPKPEAIHNDDNMDELTKMVQDAELVIADDNGSSTSEIDLDSKFCKNVDEVLDFFGNVHGHSYRQKVAPNNFFELKDEVKGEKDEILLDQCNLDPSTGTLFDKNGNTVTTERILRQCQVRDPLTLLNFQPSNSKQWSQNYHHQPASWYYQFPCQNRCGMIFSNYQMFAHHSNICPANAFQFPPFNFQHHSVNGNAISLNGNIYSSTNNQQIIPPKIVKKCPNHSVNCNCGSGSIKNSARSSQKSKPYGRKSKKPEKENIDPGKMEKLQALEWENRMGYWCQRCSLRFSTSDQLVDHMAKNIHKST